MALLDGDYDEPELQQPSRAEGGLFYWMLFGRLAWIGAVLFLVRALYRSLQGHTVGLSSLLLPLALVPLGLLCDRYFSKRVGAPVKSEWTSIS